MKVDKQITLGNLLSIVTTVLTIFGGVWWMSDQLSQLRSHDVLLDSNIKDLKAVDERMLAERELRRRSIDEKLEFLYRDRENYQRNAGERLSRLEEQNRFMIDMLKAISTKLDRSEGRPSAQ